MSYIKGKKLISNDCAYEVANALMAQGKETTVEVINYAAKVIDDKLKIVAKDSKLPTKEEYDLALKTILDENSEAQGFASIERIKRGISKIDFMKKMENLKTIDESINAYDVLGAELIGSHKNIPGYRDSVDANMESIVAQYGGNFLYGLDEANLTKLVNSNDSKLNRDIANELFAITKDASLEEIKYEIDVRKNNQPYDIFHDAGKKVTESKEAYAIAKLIAKSQYEMLMRANRAGAYVPLRSDYIVKQSHNADKLHKAGLDKWKKDIIPKLDYTKTFGLRVEAEVDKFMTAAYYNIVSGKIDNIKAPNIKPGLANRLSKHRVLHFKNADEFVDYTDIYGTKSIKDSFLGSVNYLGRSIAMMEKFGPDPDKTFDEILGGIKKTQRDEYIAKAMRQKNLDEDAANVEFEKYKESTTRKLRHQYNEVSGNTKTPVNGLKGDIGRGIRAAHNFSKLGAAGLSAVADTGFIPFEATYQGMGFMKSFLKGLAAPVVTPLKKLFNGKSHQQQLQLARQLGVGMDWATGSIMDKFAINDGLSGMTGAAQRVFFKMNGLTWLTDTFKTAFTMMSSNNLGVARKMKFDMLDPRLQSVLSKYNIGAREWDIYRSISWRNPDDGRHYVLPNKVRLLDDKVIIDYLGGKKHHTQITAAKAQLETKLRAFFVDRADFASPTPGAAERAFMYKSQQPGTYMGEIARFFWQYKSFAFTIANKIMKREVQGAYSTGSAFTRMTSMLALTTTTGMLAYSAKQMVKGERTNIAKALDGDNDRKEMWELFASGFMQGGGVGIYADLLSATQTRYGQSWTATVAGPTAGLAEDLAKIVGFGLSTGEKAIHGEDISFGRLGTLTARAVKGMTPLQNYPLVKPALDTLLWYNINEALNPGYMRRLRRNYKKEGKEFWMRPEARNPLEVVDDLGDIF